MQQSCVIVGCLNAAITKNFLEHKFQQMGRYTASELIGLILREIMTLDMIRIKSARDACITQWSEKRHVLCNVDFRSKEIEHTHYELHFTNVQHEAREIFNGCCGTGLQVLWKYIYFR
jgi:hypothetical protein